MIVKLYSIKDVITGEFSSVMQFSNQAVCERTVKEFTNIQEPNICTQNTQDKQLWYLAELNTETGMYTNNTPRLIKNLMEYKGE